MHEASAPGSALPLWLDQPAGSASCRCNLGPLPRCCGMASPQLRLPPSAMAEEREARVEEAVEACKLQACRWVCCVWGARGGRPHMGATCSAARAPFVQRWHGQRQWG